MRSKILLGGLLATVMVFPVLAADSNMWRASKLIGVNVYNEQSEKLGDVSEVLVDKGGKVDGVVIGVGGFLGMGQHDIKVDMGKLKFANEPMRSSANKEVKTTGAGSNTSSADHKWYPDHAVLSGATKDELKKMPEFKY